MNVVMKSMILHDYETLAEITSDIRTAIENIILKHDNQYLWYTKFIIDRLSKLLMNED
jgi:hypothetical protein